MYYNTFIVWGPLIANEGWRPYGTQRPKKITEKKRKQSFCILSRAMAMVQHCKSTDAAMIQNVFGISDDYLGCILIDLPCEW